MFGIDDAFLGSVAAPIIGGLLGSGGSKTSSSSQQTLDPRMANAVYGDNGVIPSAQDWYSKNKAGLNAQMLAGMNNQWNQLGASRQGYNQMQNLGMGMMGAGVAGNPFSNGGAGGREMEGGSATTPTGYTPAEVNQPGNQFVMPVQPVQPVQPGGAYASMRPTYVGNEALGGNDGRQEGFDSLNNTSSLTSSLAGLLGNLGFSGLSTALAQSNGANYGNEGRNSTAPGVDSVEGDYSNEGRNSSAPSGDSADSADSGGVDSGGADSGGADSDGGGSDGGRDGGDGYNKGGRVTRQRLHGPDPRGPDEGYGALKSGEYVVNKAAVKKYGAAFLDDINNQRLRKHG